MVPRAAGLLLVSEEKFRSTESLARSSSRCSIRFSLGLGRSLIGVLLVLVLRSDGAANRSWWGKMAELSNRGGFATPWDLDDMTRLTHKDNNQTISRCGLGQFTPDNSTCALCPKGKYGPVVGLTECLDCAAGKYVDHLGANSCEDCSYGM